MTTELRIAQLRAMRLKELDIEGAKCSPPLSFNKNQTKRKRIELIMQREAVARLSSPTPGPVSPPTIAGGPGETDARKPGFEAVAADQVVNRLNESGFPAGRIGPAVSGKDGRGGPRPGSGRKPGQTAVVCKWQSLPKFPNQTIEQGLRMLFHAWAASVGEPQIALTDKEAVDLALPYTQVLHVMGYGDKIPDWAALAITTVWVTTNTLLVKYQLARKAKPEWSLKASLFAGKVGRMFKRKSKDDKQRSNNPGDIRQEGKRQDGTGPKPDASPQPGSVL